jgi:hypothetical protein
MYSKQEASILTQQFWTSFGQYIAPVLSAEGEKINWVNYKTGEKGIRFIMVADYSTAKIAITLSHKDAGIQQLYFDKFLRLKKIFHQKIGEEWQWRELNTDEQGKPFSEIYTLLPNVSVLNKQDWPAIISFFKPRMIALDIFWSEFKYAFEGS